MRALANLWYGRKKKLSSISIGTVWKTDRCGRPCRPPS
ncbi:protein-export membrane protein [Bordetella pertussis]|nr:protein-export membrane protein [Bordetella pertussis]